MRQLQLPHYPKLVYTPRIAGTRDLCAMLDHLIDFTPEVGNHSGKVPSLEKQHPADVVDAQVRTADWLKSMGAVDTETVITNAEVKAARTSFTNIVSSAPNEVTHENLKQIKSPVAVKHLVGMLTAYDWEFVNQAKELRGFVVAKLLEECEHPNANIRLGVHTNQNDDPFVALFDKNLKPRIEFGIGDAWRPGEGVGTDQHHGWGPLRVGDGSDRPRPRGPLPAGSGRNPAAHHR